MGHWGFPMAQEPPPGQSSAPRVPPAAPPLQQLTVSPPSALWPHCVLTDPHHTPRLCHTPVTRPYTGSSSPICVCPPCPGLPVHTSSPRRTLIPICLRTVGPPRITRCALAHSHLCCVLCLQSASDGFWKSVATRVPKEPPEIRILNPYFIQEAAFTLIGLPFNNGLMGRGVRRLDPGRGRKGRGPEVPWEGRTGRQWGDRGLRPQTQSSALGSFSKGLSLALHPSPAPPSRTSRPSAVWP